MRAVKKAVLVIVCFLWLVPLLLLVRGSLMPEEAIVDRRATWSLTTENFRALFAEGKVVIGLRNSLLTASTATLVAALVAAPAAYAAAQQKLMLRGVFGWILTTRILPPAAVLIPLFVLAQVAHATDSLLGVAVIIGASNVPIMAWLMRQFIAEIPSNLIDALRIDGASEWAVVRWLVIPLAGPGLATALFLCFVLGWNDYLFSSVLISAPALKTLPVVSADFVTGYRIKWGLMLACDVVLIAPPVILSVLAAPHIVKIMLPRTTKS